MLDFNVLQRFFFTKWKLIVSLSFIGLMTFLLINESVQQIEFFTTTSSVTPQQKKAVTKKLALIPSQKNIKANLALFGQYQPDIQVMQASNYRITGILTSPNTQMATFIIAEEKEPDKLYVIGDEIFPGVKIKKILPDRIIVQNHGHLESIMLSMENFDDGPQKSTKRSSKKVNYYNARKRK